MIILVGVGGSLYQSFNDTTYTITVTDKERVVKTDKKSSDNSTNVESYYLVWGTDQTTGEEFVFENVDSLIRFKFNSSDIQGQLHEGETYNITVIGLRIPFLSEYQNIISVDKINDGVL